MIMKNQSKIYIAGQMTGKFLYNRPKFYLHHFTLWLKGYKVMNPAVLPFGFTHQEYMEICYKMLDSCEIVLMLKGWEKSLGAKMEYEYALKKEKTIMFERKKGE